MGKRVSREKKDDIVINVISPQKWLRKIGQEPNAPLQNKKLVDHPAEKELVTLIV